MLNQHAIKVTQHSCMPSPTNNIWFSPSQTENLNYEKWNQSFVVSKDWARRVRGGWEWWNDTEPEGTYDVLCMLLPNDRIKLVIQYGIRERKKSDVFLDPWLWTMTSLKIPQNVQRIPSSHRLIWTQMVDWSNRLVTTTSHTISLAKVTGYQSYALWYQARGVIEKR